MKKTLSILALFGTLLSQTSEAKREFILKASCYPSVVRYVDQKDSPHNFFVIDADGDNIVDQAFFPNDPILNKKLIKISKNDPDHQIYQEFYDNGIKFCD